MEATASLLIAVPTSVYSIWAVFNPENNPFFGIGLKESELTQTGRDMSYFAVSVSLVIWFGVLVLLGDPIHWITFSCIVLGSYLKFSINI